MSQFLSLEREQEIFQKSKINDASNAGAIIGTKIANQTINKHNKNSEEIHTKK